MIDLECIPEGKRKVTLVMTSEEDFGAREMIKVLAHFIKQQIDQHRISYSEVALKETDKVVITQEEQPSPIQLVKP